MKSISNRPNESNIVCENNEMKNMKMRRKY